MGRIEVVFICLFAQRFPRDPSLSGAWCPRFFPIDQTLLLHGVALPP